VNNPQRWYSVEQGGQRYEVKAASRGAAVRYLKAVLREPRPYEPGYCIRTAPPLNPNPPTRSEHSLEGTAVNGPMPVGERESFR
jgi:hypothetical protein